LIRNEKMEKKRILFLAWIFGNEIDIG